jgi:beta-phosphoglucomutase
MAEQPTIKAVIFDMDGVLCDSEPLINAAAVEMFREKGLIVRPEDFVPFVGTGEDRYISGVAELYGFPLDIAAAKKRAYEIYLDLVPQKLEAFPGAKALVESCRTAGLLVAVASSADFIKIDANLKKIGLPPERWDAIVSAEDVTNKKPAPDIFLTAASKLGLAASECVVIEDAVNGVQAAKAAGMRCIAVAHTFAPENLASADMIRSGIAEIRIEDLELRPTVPPVICPPPASYPPALVWGFWATLGFSLLVMVGDVIGQATVAFLYSIGSAITGQHVDWDAIDSNGLFLGLATIAGAPLVIGLSWLFAWLRKGLPPAVYLGLNRVSAGQVVGWLMILGAFVAVSDLITYLLGKPIVPEFMHQIYETAGSIPILLVALLIAAPLAEEVLFRGFMFEGLARSAVGLPGAMLITSAVWAALHLQYDFYGIGQIFFSGILLGYARVRTGSLYTCIIMHAVMNMIATVELLIQRHFL